MGVLALWGAFPIIYGAVNHKLWSVIIMGVISAPYQTINYGIIPKGAVHILGEINQNLIWRVGGADDTHNNYCP